MAFPQVATTTNALDDTAHVSTVVTMPSGSTTGDLVIICASKDGSGLFTVASGTGWTTATNATDGSAALGVFWKVFTGSGDNLTLSHASETTVYLGYRITGHNSQVEVGTAATGATNLPDPPSLTASWGAEENLWIATYGWDGNRTNTSYPASYGSNQITNNGTGAGSNGAAMTSQQLSAATENPGTGAISVSDGWIAQTIVVRPAPAGTPVSLAFKRKDGLYLPLRDSDPWSTKGGWL